MKKLTGKQVRLLRGIGHHLQPAIMIGKEALSEALLASLDQALSRHELIKVKLQEGCALDRREVAGMLSLKSGAETVQVLGNTILLYRPADPPVIKLT